MEEFETKITPEEIMDTKVQILSGLRRRYLIHKADFIMHTALGKTQLAQQSQEQMQDCITAYGAVETGM